MSEKRPNVIPNGGGGLSKAEQEAVEAMRLKTEKQMAEIAEKNKTKDSEVLKPAIVSETEDNKVVDMSKYDSISQPQFDAPFDVISLPSNGKLYDNGKKTIKVAFLTASDENVLSNPNLMENGEFLEILMNRKILDSNIRYRDLGIGDRNAIMIWLRATGYGHEYPITVFDPKTAEPFEHIVDLSKLKTKKLEVDIDEEGLIDFTLPISNVNVKFKLLTAGMVEDIEQHAKYKMDNDVDVDTVTYTLEQQIVEIDGNRERDFINNFIKYMRVGDASALRDYIDSLDYGIDMELEIRTPGGESITTFLPINRRFFWPKS